MDTAGGSSRDTWRNASANSAWDSTTSRTAGQLLARRQPSAACWSSEPR
ncbi:hypothetical protein [Sinosporangium siamense]|nr:hypothetical protein [Sinosporangium siamense]